MSDHENLPLGFVVREAPYAQRSPRAQLDVALAAATLETPLELYFLGDGIWQLTARRDPAGANLPPGLKGWAALPGLTEVRFFAEPNQCNRLKRLGAETVVPVQPLDNSSMARRWRACRKVMAL